MKEDNLLQCHYCPEDDNLWLPSAFTHSGNSYLGKKRICNDCWQNKYRRVTGRCILCNRVIRSWRKVEHLENPFMHKSGSASCRPVVQFKAVLNLHHFVG